VTPFVQDVDFTLYVGDAVEVLRELPDESVHCCVTSPPYWGLRDYGTEGQIGLEATPEAFVESMVQVFREVRRVLRLDGTLWLNLGDSYAGHNATGFREGSEAKNGGVSNKNGVGYVPGMKPKDLVGIPWRVAFALQQPYYTGRIRDERDRLWLAAMVDTEGCIHIHKRSAGAKSHTHTLVDGSTVDYERKTDTYGVMVSIDNTSKALIDRIEAIVGQGSRYTHEKGVGKSNRKQTLYRITLTGQQSRELLRELYPHLVAKQHEARIAYHAPSSGAGAEEAWQAVKALHNGEPTTVDYPEPETLFEPGWYLRSDVIWGKPNPMPESVTDRPTKAHEYVFLLARSPRYFFDQEAVREKYQPSSLERERYGNSNAYGSQFAGSPTDTRSGKVLAPGEINSKARGPDGRKNTRALGKENSAQHRDGERWPNGGRNIRSVWEIATQPYAEAHFATFPEALPERCIKAGCPDGGTVLDPFMGSGTTALVARRLGRKSVGIELNPEYAKLCARRLQQLSLFGGQAA
jgi:DNA modification methylase